MSTKVYNGIRFKSKNIQEVTQQLISLRPKAIEIGNKTVNENIGLAFASVVMNSDKTINKNLTKENFEENPKMFLFYLNLAIQDSFKRDYRKIYEPSFLFSVMLFPSVDGTLYGYYLDDNNREYSKLLLEEIAEEFHYQNQSDPPKDIVEEQWEEREKIWNEILGDNALNERGWNFEIVKAKDFELDQKKAYNTIEQLIPKVPPITAKEEIPICVDFDGTCVTHDYPNLGKDVGAQEVLQELLAAGHKLILFTMRDNKELDDAVKWFETNNIKLWGIQKNPTQHKWTSSPKAHGHIYIDDAALGCPLIFDPSIHEKPFVNWKAIKIKLVQQGILL